jgi:hypothetical protein
MKTKLLTVTIAMLALCAVTSVAQDVSEGNGVAFYERFAIKPFGVAETQDFEEVEYGAGLGLTYEIVGNLRGNIEAISFDSDHRFIDKGNVGLEFIAPISPKVALIPEGGISRHFENSEYGFYVGLGIGGNIKGPVDFFVKGRALREDGISGGANSNGVQQWSAGFLAGIQVNF